LDEELLERLRLRDRDALGDLAERYGRALTRAGYLYLGDVHAAEDVAQETLIATWDGTKRAREGTQLRAWIFGMLFNQARKYRRSLWRRIRRERAAAWRTRSNDAGEAERQERVEILRKAMGQLDEALRAVIIMRYEQGLSVAETAQALGLPEGTVKSRTHAAREQLRKHMERLS